VSWVLVAVAVVWAFSLLLVVALCLSARRIDKEISVADEVPPPPRSAAPEPPAAIEDISTARRAALS
jgi:hypothetical protein